MFSQNVLVGKKKKTKYVHGAGHKSLYTYILCTKLCYLRHRAAKKSGCNSAMAREGEGEREREEVSLFVFAGVTRRGMAGFC